MPWLADSVARLAGHGGVPRLPAAEWLLAKGRRSRDGVHDWRGWLMAGCGLGPDVLRDHPAGPCTAAAGTGHTTADHTAARAWARAEPAHLLTAIDHLQLAAPVPVALDAQESAALLGHLNAHLHGSGFELSESADGGWLCACPQGLLCQTVEPAAALGRNLRDFLPTGRDAARLRALVNELQMLLHEHPVNERRAALGKPVVNSVWLWGLGAPRAPVGSVAGRLLTDDAWLAGLWRLHGGQVRPMTSLADAIAEGADDLRVAGVHAGAVPGDAAALQDLEAGLLSPVRDALVASRIERVALLAGERAFDLTPAARWAAWRRSRPLDEALE